MATQRTTHELSARLGAVLGSVDISLDAELTRYRRSRRLTGLSGEDICREDAYRNTQSDPASDVEPVEATLVSTPPPVPPNRKLMAAGYYDRDSQDANPPSIRFWAQQKSSNSSNELTSHSASISTSALLSSLTEADQTKAKAVGSGIVPTIAPQTHSPLSQVTQAHQPGESAQTLSGISTPSSYLASSTKLIGSLEDKSAQPNPAELAATGQSRRKTVSLLAGAVLGCLGLLTGLGASYVMSNSLAEQRLANELADPSPVLGIENTAAATFDPPGPDLSSAEFVQLKIDNLSSLQMPKSDPIIPSTISAGQPPTTPSHPSGLSSAGPVETVIPSVARPNSASVATETQAAVLPIGQTYYVTVPFRSEQGLWQIRQSISEAFVRRFADGNRIQVGAFSNAQSAEQFLEKLKENNIVAEVYGPTTE